MKPILFMEPVLKENIWGGTRLIDEYGYSSLSGRIGECWGICAHPEGDCIVKDGIYKGKNLSCLWKEEPSLFGNLKGDRFPLMIKMIDAKEDLSIQVHPDDDYAARQEKGALGKTEGWYIMDCKEGATLIAGHNAKSRAELKEMIEQGRWEELICEIPIKKGDFIQIDPGTVHAIKGGTMVLEVEQNSDVTYRVYDYDRKVDGKLRPLRIDKAVEVITVPTLPIEHVKRSSLNVVENEMCELISCRYYVAWRLKLTDAVSLEQKYPFLILSVMRGEGTLNGQTIRKGDYLILPAGFGQVKLKGNADIIVSTVNKGEECYD